MSVEIIFQFDNFFGTVMRKRAGKVLKDDFFAIREDRQQHKKENISYEINDRKGQPGKRIYEYMEKES